MRRRRLRYSHNTRKYYATGSWFIPFGVGYSAMMLSLERVAQIGIALAARLPIQGERRRRRRFAAGAAKSR
jgi:hypothetical protein